MIPPVANGPAEAGETARLREAGAAFEALILQQMLRGAMPDADGAGGIGLGALAADLAGASPFGVARLLESRT